jgi:lipoate-protein ligase A
MSTWIVERRSGDAATLHRRDALADARRRVTVLEVAAPALVLGSTQRRDVVDDEATRARGAGLVRRRTGGGAVFLDPGQHVWIDVTISADDPLWRSDVAQAFDWLGRAWVSTMVGLGLDDASMNAEAVCHSVLGRIICFAGLGFGEVSTPRGKVVGLSQRRTRAGAWFQCALVRRWDTGPYRDLLAPGLAAATDDPDSELAAVRVECIDATADDVVDAFVRHLPA